MSATKAAGLSAGDGALLALALGMAWALKRFYSTATPEELAWVLRPTATAVSALCGSQFVEEAHAGYFSRELHFMIAPACAGVNFMIAAFCTTVFGFTRAGRTFRAKLALFALCGLSSYVATLAANTIRILIGVWLHARPFVWGPLDTGQLFRIQGAAVYFLALSALYASGRALLARIPDAPDATR